MVEALEYVIYSNTPSHMKVLWAKRIDAAQTFLIPVAKYIFHLNQG